MPLVRSAVAAAAGVSVGLATLVALGVVVRPLERAGTDGYGAVEVDAAEAGVREGSGEATGADGVGGGRVGEGGFEGRPDLGAEGGSGFTVSRLEGLVRDGGDQLAALVAELAELGALARRLGLGQGRAEGEELVEQVGLGTGEGVDEPGADGGLAEGVDLLGGGLVGLGRGSPGGGEVLGRQGVQLVRHVLDTHGVSLPDPELL